jgi:hypothetical protein
LLRGHINGDQYYASFRQFRAFVRAVDNRKCRTTISGNSIQLCHLWNAKPCLVHHENSDNAPAAQFLTALPANDWPATNWYKQSVYDFQGNKLGEIADWLVDHDGKNTAVFIGVGGLLGAGEKYVAVPFDAIHFKKKDNTWYPVMNTTRDALKSATGYRYDSNTQTWQPEAASVGGGKGK